MQSRHSLQKIGNQYSQITMHIAQAGIREDFSAANYDHKNKYKCVQTQIIRQIIKLYLLVYKLKLQLKHTLNLSHVKKFKLISCNK